MTIRRVLLPLALALSAGAAGVASAASTGGPAPSYPGSRVAIAVGKSQRASSIVTVTVTGTNAVFDPDSPNPTPYSLELFVQSRAAAPTCPRAYTDELNNVVNLGSRSVLHIGQNLGMGPSGAFKRTVRYRSGSVRSVVYCAYSRLITDDAAYAQLRQTLAKPRRR